MKTVCITGATAGIGQATALLFAKKGYRLIITGRRNERLNLLKGKVEEISNAECVPLCFDVQDKNAVNDALQFFKGHVDILVNNAGLSRGRDPIQNGSDDDWDQMIDTNVKGLLYVTQAVLPKIPTDGSGHIINISSISGKQVYGGGTVYCATKFAVDALNKGMRIDLLEKNIRVTSINPGAVNTEFSTVRFYGNKEKADATYNGYTPLSAEDIAECIVWSAERPAHVNINEMIVMPTAQASVNHLKREV